MRFTPTPVPCRGRARMPLLLHPPLVAEKLAEVKQLDVQELMPTQVYLQLGMAILQGRLVGDILGQRWVSQCGCATGPGCHRRHWRQAG